MAKWWKMLEEKLGLKPGNLSHLQIAIIVAAIAGIVIMLMNSFVSVKELEPLDDRAVEGGAAADEKPVFKPGGEKEAQFSDYEASYENEIKEILTKIVGVGEVDVLVTVDSTEEIIIERDVNESQQMTDEVDTHGAKRHITSTSRSGDVAMTKDSPIIKRIVRPKIRGVIVVAAGAENLTIKKMIQEAVSRGMDVPATKISIVPSKRR